MKGIVHIIDYLSYGSALVALIFFWYLKNFKLRTINILAGLLALSLVSDTLSLFTILVLKQSNVVIVNIFLIGQFILTYLMYHSLYLKKNKGYPKFIIGLVIVLCFTNSVFWQPFKTFQTFNWAVTSVAIAGLAFGHFLYMIKYPIRSFEKSPGHWISVGLLFYNTIGIAIQGIAVYFENSEIHWWMFHNLSNIFKGICFCMAIWWASKREPDWDQPKPHDN